MTAGLRGWTPAAEVRFDRDVEVRGLRFRVRGTRPAGSSAAVSYLLVHGVGMSYRTLRDVHSALSAGAPVCAVDIPGFGCRPVPDRPMSVEEMAAVLGEVCDAVGMTAVVVVGHSMGAQWALELALARPDLVAGTVLIGPVVDRDRRTAPRQAMALAADVLREPPRTAVIAVGDYLRASARWYASQVREMVAYPIDERIREARSPVLIVRGGMDPVATVAWCRGLRDRGRDAELVVVPAVAHNVQVSRPRAVASAVEDFVRRRVVPGLTRA